MKPYGVPRVPQLDNPDLADIAEFGMKSSTGQLRGKGGEFRGSQKSEKRKQARRHFKKSERRRWKQEIEGRVLDDGDSTSE